MRKDKNSARRRFRMPIKELYTSRVYAIEEFDARIDESEEQIVRGEVFFDEEVMAEMRNFITSM